MTTTSIIEAAYSMKNLTLEEFGLIVALSEYPHGRDRTAIVKGLKHLTSVLTKRFRYIKRERVETIIGDLVAKGAVSITTSQYGYEIEVAPTGSSPEFSRS